ncbi:MAG TPA: hypothetical protein VGI42_03635 [Chthoniobacterales bacterium]
MWAGSIEARLKQNPETVFEIRPFRGGWECFEAPGVEPYYTGPKAKQFALDYAKGRTAMRKGEIRVFNSAGVIEETILFDNSGQQVSDGRGC